MWVIDNWDGLWCVFAVTSKKEYSTIKQFEEIEDAIELVRYLNGGSVPDPIMMDFDDEDIEEIKVLKPNSSIE